MSTSGGSSRRGGAKATQASPALRAALAGIESKIRTRKTEVGYILSPQGDVVIRKTGTARKITWTPAEQAQARGNVFTHNHPVDTALSPPDIAFAMINGVSEMRAVSAGHTYVARPGANGWNRELWRQVKPVAEGMTVSRKTLYRVMMMRNAISYEEANQRIFHEIWTELSKRFGFIYERSPA